MNGKLAQAHAAWLRTMDWKYVATGTWANPISEAAALAAVTRWLAFSPTGYAAVGLQRGPIAKRLHVHMLIGGVKREPLTAKLLSSSWVKSGHVLVEGYHPARGFVEYLVDQADEVEVIGAPHHRDEHSR